MGNEQSTPAPTRDAATRKPHLRVHMEQGKCTMIVDGQVSTHVQM